MQAAREIGEQALDLEGVDQAVRAREEKLEMLGSIFVQFVPDVGVKQG